MNFIPAVEWREVGRSRSRYHKAQKLGQLSLLLVFLAGHSVEVGILKRDSWFLEELAGWEGKAHEG